MISFELYRIFVAVAEEGNITRASKKLNTSQPAITKQIKNLESQIAFRLFDRKSNGMILTKDGEELYQKLKKPIEELNKINININAEKKINIGTHNHMGGLIFGEPVNKYTLKNPNVNLNMVNEEMDSLLNKIQNEELDIVFAKKYNNFVPENLNFIKLGEMHETFIVNKNSEYVNKIFTFENLKNKTIYIPRTYEQTTKNIEKLTASKNLNLKNSNYRAIVRLIEEGMVIGVITAEYLYDWEWEKFNLVEVKNDIGLGTVDFGIYLGKRKFKELNDFVKIIKEYFSEK